VQEWEKELEQHRHESRKNEREDKLLRADIGDRMSAGQPEQAAALLFERMLDESYFSDAWWSTTMRDVAASLVKDEQHWKQALAVVWSISEPWQKVQSLISIAVALVRSGLKEKAQYVLFEAEAVAQSIEKDNETRTAPYAEARNIARDNALGEVAGALVVAQELESAKVVATSISDGKWQRDHVLFEIVHALAKEEQWNKALDTMQNIEEDTWSILALGVIIHALIEHGEHSYALQLLQKEWMDATTRIELLERVRLARDFILLHPEIGWEFYLAFDWVDNFLKG
jgi:hypothetical protein